MSRRIAVLNSFALMLLGAWGGMLPTLHAQEEAPARQPLLSRGANELDTDIAPSQQGRPRLDRQRLASPDLRVPLERRAVEEPADPRVDQLLQNWSQHTKQIKKLQGKHFRATRNFTFGVEKIAEGMFYYEAPDKGRLDLAPYSPLVKPSQNGPRKVRRAAPDGKTVELEFEADVKKEMWICDGKQLKMVNVKEQTYDVVDIPEKQRGENIMDGPLPFLLGMPPEKAKARFRFVLASENDEEFQILITPKLQQDAAEWKRAVLSLSRKTYLPKEVHLYDPAGTIETVYKFSDLEANKFKITLFGNNTFDPYLFNYTRVVHNPANSKRGPGNNDGKLQQTADSSFGMPSLTGLHFTEAQKIAKQLELRLEKFKPGSSATAQGQLYHVERQWPRAGEQVRPGSSVHLQLYTKPQAAKTGGDQESRNTAKPADARE